MVNEVEVFYKVRKSPPPELDIKVRRGIRRLKVRRFAGLLTMVFIFAFSFGAALRLLLLRDGKVPQVISVSVQENLKESICPGVAPLKVQVEPEGVYSYKVYVNGDVYREGVTSKVIDDSIVINDFVNYVNLQIVDLINGGEEDLSWFVYNF